MARQKYPLRMVWREALGGTLSTLGRLACLSALRDPQSRRHLHGRLAAELEPEDIDQALRLAHELLWRDWISSSLEQQHADLLLHLRSLSPDLEPVLVEWLRGEPFQGYAPDSAMEQERDLFSQNLKILLKLLHNQYSSQATETRISASESIPAGIVEAIRLFQERYADPDLSLGAVAAAVNMSEKRLGRLFREAIGQPFRQYLRAMRIKKAADLLARSGHDIKAIASLTGYRYPSYFGEDFRLLMGCTPLEFRKKSALLIKRGSAPEEGKNS